MIPGLGKHCGSMAEPACSGMRMFWLIWRSTENRRSWASLSRSRKRHLQCAKAVLRSKLWEARHEARETSLPSFAQILIDQTKIAEETVESLNQRIEDSYRNHMY